jgi:CHRD domain
MLSIFKNRIGLVSLSVALISSALASSAALADTVALQANLQPSSEVPPHVSKGHGALKATFDTTTNTLQWVVTYSGLTGPTTMAHFHGPAPVGQNAKVQVPIPMDQLPSPIKGEAKLTDAQANDLLGGQYYFNIHTAKNPGGEIRGQVMPAN